MKIDWEEVALIAGTILGLVLKAALVCAAYKFMTR